jgi:hypothetical protein
MTSRSSALYFDVGFAMITPVTLAGYGRPEPAPRTRSRKNASRNAAIGSWVRRDNQYRQRQLRQRAASRGPDRGVRAALRRFRLVEHHHLGDEGLPVADVRQAAGSRNGAKIFGRIADVIGLVIILREQLQ